MKFHLTIFFAFLFITSFAKNNTFEKLAEVNKYWKQQKDVDPATLPQLTADEHGWITAHLSLVEKTLRARSTTHLSARQKQNRKLCLNLLHKYWLKGQFPVNEDISHRTPIFIDKHDNFCAVGYLVKESGNETVARMIAAKTNFAYVHEMKYAELSAWAKEYGFTTDELAWIQPGYPSPSHSRPIGRGVDGEVKELYPDEPDGRLYIGGSFVNVDSTIVANNIAYVTQVGPDYTWHKMGSGTNGTVNAIINYDSLLFAGGLFTLAGDSIVNNVAYWDGTLWHSAGCLSGTVNTFLVFRDTLYAAGAFDICPALPGANFAWWDGNTWQPITGLAGTINKLQAIPSAIIIGGAFWSGTDTVNIIKWNSQTGYTPFLNKVSNEVKDIELFQDSMYAVCKRTSPTDSNLFQKLRNNAWVGIDSILAGSFGPEFGLLSFNTLCAESSTLNMGGQFSFAEMIGYYYENCFNMGLTPSFNVDSAVNKMVLFNGDLFAAGKFKNGLNETNYSDTIVRLNGIAKRNLSWVQVPEIYTETCSIYPNPAIPESVVTIINNFHATRFTLRDIVSKVLATGLVHNERYELTLPDLMPGLYFIDLSNDNGAHVISKITVR